MESSGLLFGVEIPQQVKHSRVIVGVKLRCDIICALRFAGLVLANSHFHILISESCGERTIGVGVLLKVSDLLFATFSDMLVHTVVAPIFD